MTELSAEACARSRNIRAHLLRLINERTQDKTARALGIDPGTFSRWLTSDAGLDRACELLAVLELRVKDLHAPDFDEGYVTSLEGIARAKLDMRKGAR
jgi:transcriptional regulator with XRE-family HTH domain